MIKPDIDMERSPERPRGRLCPMTKRNRNRTDVLRYAAEGILSCTRNNSTGEHIPTFHAGARALPADCGNAALELVLEGLLRYEHHSDERGHRTYGHGAVTPTKVGREIASAWRVADHRKLVAGKVLR